MVEISEAAFEAAIEQALLAGGPDAPAGEIREPTLPFGAESIPGGYRRRTPQDYDRHLCLLPQDVLDFVRATQPKTWARLKQHHGAEVRERFLSRLAREVARRGTLDVLRKGVKDSGCKLQLAYFRPASGLNEELERLYRGNLFAVVRQLRYSEKNDNSLDLGLFLNGLPIFTAELKNPLTGQDVQDAIKQYKSDRDPREPLLAPGRCLAHFAVDPDLVYVTTALDRGATRFLPFNRGRFGGAGNKPVPPTRKGYATDYLWQRVWARDSVLDLVRQFIHEVEDDKKIGKKTRKRSLIFPRYHQLDAVRRMVRHAREHGAGERYLIQHSAGSGKSFTIAWLAHRLSTLHDGQDRRVFDSIVVITDRRVLDRQLQHTVRQFEQTLGVVENIDTTSRQLKEALEAGKTIIVTTLQKFPVIAENITELPGKRFAVIVDEAHSSQSGESTKSLKSVLAAGGLEEAEAEEAAAQTPEEELESLVLAEAEKRGRLPNLSMFAFTATPKAKTLELFGTPCTDGPSPRRGANVRYTEAGMNGVPETQTAKVYDRPECRFLVVANKFQTGFDQPLLHTMYVDKKLGGVNAVQTLSRLNRTHPDKRGTMVLDFANDAETIQKAFEPYYEATLLSEATDPHLLYDVQQRLLDFDVFTEAEVKDFAALYYDRGTEQDEIYAALEPFVDRFAALGEDERLDFRGQLTDYVRLYAFLSQVLTFADAELEMLYAFARHLRRLVKGDPATLPLEVQQNIDMESYRIQETSSGAVPLGGGQGILDPSRAKDHRGPAAEDLEPLSVIIAALNERFGLDMGDGDKVTVEQVIGKLEGDAALDASARANTRENVRLVFDEKVEDAFQEIVESNFELYKRITDDRSFGAALKTLLFDDYMRTHRQAEELLKEHESKTLEFKSTLRWNVKEERKDPKVVTHSVLKTIAAFLNTEGGDLLIGVADDKSVPGIAADRLDSDDRFLLHLSHVVAQGLGDRAGTCIDPRIQLVGDKPVCLVGCKRSPEPVYLKWKGVEQSAEGDFFVRVGAQTKKLSPESAAEYVRTRFSKAPSAPRPSE